MATLYTNMGIVCFEKGDYDAALASYQKGLALAEELGDKQLVSIATGCIGSVWQRKGKFDLAMQHFEHDLELAEELGDKQGISIAKGLIGELYSVMGEFDKAIEFMQDNLTITEELGYQKGTAKALNTLGDIYFYKKDYKTSLDFYDRSIGVTRTIGNKLVLGFSLVEKGNVLLSTGEAEKARLNLEEAVTIAKELNHPDLLYDTKLLYSKILMVGGKNDEAKSLLEWLLNQPIGKRELAAVHFKLSKIEQGTAHKEKALALYRELYQETPMFVFELRMNELEKMRG
jgi:tetratricopeptide (TPR) repeat protein